MSNSASIPRSTSPEPSQQSSGVLNFILSRLGRPSKSVSRASGSTVSGVNHDEVGGPGKPGRDDQDVQSKLTVSRAIPEEGPSQHIPEDGLGDSLQIHARRGISLPQASKLGAKAGNQWNFSRQDPRRARRSAQEWVRDASPVNSNWSQGLAQYHPDSNGMASLQADDPVTAEDSRFEEEGVRYRRRSRSATELEKSKNRQQMLKDLEASEERGRSLNEKNKSPHGSKRTSFEAGIQQAKDSPRPSLEKMQRQGSRNEFLPNELIQRSHLFNGR